MTRIISSLAVFLFFFSTLNSQSVYLKHEDYCMDRLEYSGTDSSTPYVSYSAKVGDNSFLVFDVGRENTRWDKEVPGKLTYCNALKMDKTLVQQINNGTIKLYMVRETPTHYNVSLVDKAIFYEQYGKAIDFVTEDAEFVLYLDNLVSDVNLAKPSSKMEVYIDGTLKMQCATAYILSKKENSRSVNYKEYVFLPEVGIVEKGAVSEYGQSSVLKLNKIAKRTYKEVLSSMCDQMQASYYDSTTPGYTTTETPGSYDDLTSKGGDIPSAYGTEPCVPSQVNGIHTVQKGETLFGISRRYGISVDQLKNWNKLTDANIISVCQQLYVNEPSSVAGKPTTGITTTTEKGGTTISGQTYWINAPEVHAVRPGETVAGLAYMYGYTEERFRKMNGLGTNELIYAGQKLRTSDCVCPTLQSTTKDQPLPYEVETEVLTSKGNPDVYFRPVKVHQVQKAETLFSIAKLYNTTVDRLQELNGLKKGESIKPEQRIYVQ